MKVWHRFMDWLIPPEPVTVAPWEPPALSPAALAGPMGMHTGNRTNNPVPGPALTAAPTQDPPPPHGRQALTLMPPLPTEWEERAWTAYKHLGAARRAVNWLANNASRCHLYIGKVSQDGVSPPDPIDAPGLAGDLLDELRDSLGESALLKRMAQHILVSGATWLAGYPAPPAPDQLTTPTTPTSGNMEPPIEPEPGPGGDPRTDWSVLSRKEWMDGEGGGIRLKLPTHPRRAPDGWVSFRPDEDVVLIPIYEPDARDAHYATSEFEAALRDTDELDGLSRRVAADIKSRLIGGGVAAVAESATMPNPGASAGGNPLNADPFITAVNAAARTAIQNPDSPDATLPIWVKVSDEAFAGDGPIKHLTFATPFDDAIPTLREEARKAIAADLDIPAEIVLGIEDVNHWGAWAISDDAVRSHLGPLLTTIVNGITLKIIWPVLRAHDETKVEDLCVWWSAAAVTQRPDRSEVTLKSEQQGIIGGKAARRELGFSEDDKPEPDESPAPAPAAGQPGQQPGQQDEQRNVRQGGQPNPGNTPNPPQRAAQESGGSRRARPPVRAA